MLEPILPARYLQNRGAFGQLEVVILQHRHQAVRIEGRVGRLHVLAGEQVDHLLIDRNVVLAEEQPNWPACHRHGMHIELHGLDVLLFMVSWARRGSSSGLGE